MISMRFFSVFTMVVLSFWSCKTQRFLPEELPTERIYFGYGGGFTGRESGFIALKNGQLFMQRDISGGQIGNAELEPADSKAMKNVFKSMNELPLDTLQINTPGNLYYFMQYVDEDKTYNKWVWGDINQPVLPEIDSLYRQLRKMTGRLKPRQD